MFYVFFNSIQVLYSSYCDTFDVCREIGKCFTDLAGDSDCRVIVLSGAGKVFSAGESVT
jgi:enoyl-CoA hydratase/carnithine racemase